MRHQYSVVGVKDAAPQEVGGKLTFGVVLKDNPKYEQCVFIFEDLNFEEAPDDQLQLSVGFALIEPGGARKKQDEMQPDLIEFMTELIQQVSVDILEASMKKEQGIE